MVLSYNEIFTVAWYRSLNTLERLAVNCWLKTGDDRLICWLRPSSATLQQFDYDVTQQILAVS